MNGTRIAFATVVLAGTFLVQSPASAQISTLGVRLGFARATQVGGFADLIEDVGGKTQSRTGVVAGGYVVYDNPVFPGPLSVQAGLELAQKGMRIPSDGGLKERALDITYLEVPVLARASHTVGQYQPYAVAGPVLAMRMSTAGAVDGQDVDTGDEVKSTDLGFAFGVGGRRGPFGVELRYVLGLSNISASNDPDEAARNRHLSVVGSYEIPFPW
jgi:hypothetical protein